MRKMPFGADGSAEASGRRSTLLATTAVLWPIVVFDIAGPIIVQSVARANGASLTGALALSGVPPAAWILAGMLWRRRLDVIGVFVLTSIIVATLIGLATGSGRLYLLDGAILTGVFGLVCLGTLATSRPLMFHFALESKGGVESASGKEFADLWRYAGFRRVFVVLTAVWGAAFVIQAVINIAIIEATSTEKAFLINKILP
jgi:intracellular septation protein A